MIKNNKRGTHVGVILSFLIFVTFLAFLYSITEPATRVSRDKLDLLEYLKIELLKEFSESMSTLTIKIENSAGTCREFEDFNGLNGLGAVVKDNEEDIIPSYIDSKGVAEVDNVSEGIMKFYYSKQFDRINDPGWSCTLLIKDEDYEIKIFRTTEEIFESKIINISENINESITYYGELKEKLGVPLDTEFGFTFTNGTKDFIAGTEEKEVSVDVYSEEVPIQYLDSEANINPGFLSIRVW